jgi:DNA ligase 1
MKDFALLLDALSNTPSRNGKLTLLRNYFRASPDPDRGFALAALTDEMPVTIPLRWVLTELSASHFDPVLFKFSRDYVGDTAETLSLLWPDTGREGPPIRLSEIVDVVKLTSGQRIAEQIARWLDGMDTNERWALLKFLSGALRVGVSARLAKLSIAKAFDHTPEEIEELWHGLRPPYLELFHWLEGKAQRPLSADVPTFKPLMLSNPLEDKDWETLDLKDMAVEWKWDGIRVQFASKGNVVSLFSRNGDDIGAAFPEIVTNQNFKGILDGELLVKQGDAIASFSDLQQRLNRKTVNPGLLKKYPAHIRLYDALELDGEDLRPLSFDERRKRLELWHAGRPPHHTDLSPLVFPTNKVELRRMWESTREGGIEGLMIKLRESPYIAGRPQGKWYKWKRTPLTADCVLMYAQRGSGKRSSFYSDYTFGVWKQEEDERVLVPVGKAYSGFTDAELLQIDKFIRENTVERFGPVRSVSPDLVFEIAFDAINVSKRHKAGLAMRFPRISRIRWDKPAAEADELTALLKLAS